MNVADRLNQFVAAYKRRSVDVDNFPLEQPFQCVDLVDQWSMFLGGPNMTGNARDYAGRENSFWYWVPKYSGSPSPGDIVVWNPPMGNGWGHVGVFVSGTWDNFVSFDQNWEGNYAEYARHNGANVAGCMRARNSSTMSPTPSEIELTRRLKEVEADRDRVVNLFQQANYKLAQSLYLLFEGRPATDPEARAWINTHPVDTIVSGIQKGRKPLTVGEAQEQLNKIRELLK